MVYKPKRKYEWNENFKFNVDANVVGSVIERIEAENGEVTKEAFLEASRSEDSPTHDLFEWDNDLAAEKYRLGQARSVITALRIVYINADNERKQVNAFVKVSEPHTRTVYNNIHEALSDDTKKEIVLNRIKAELEAFVIRNQNIEELADILEEQAKKIREKKGETT